MGEWENAVRDELAVYRRQTGNEVVRLAEVYDVVLPRVRGQFPKNNHPKAKIRQVLQDLRDQGEVTHLDTGRYALNSLDYSTLSDDAKAAIEEPPDEESRRELTAERIQRDMERTKSSEPRRAQRVVDQLLRSETLVTTLKEQYDSTCQLCGARRKQGSETAYSECHHVKPLGSPHDGPDELPNMLVLCPNHHIDFDYGMVRVDPQSFEIEHAYDEEVYTELEVQHDVATEYLLYHNQELASL